MRRLGKKRDQVGRFLMGCAMVGLSAGSGGILAVIVPLVALGVVIAGGAWLARIWGYTHRAFSARQSSGTGAVDSARAVQRRGDAAGEIDGEEFQRRPVGVNVH
jgi:uncharacterized membrane protein